MATIKINPFTPASDYYTQSTFNIGTKTSQDSWMSEFYD
jgi:hypothetical protein